LCGKTLDLWWLASRGHRVTGVELTEQACQQLFQERGVHPEVSEVGAFRQWRGGGLRVLQGDVFHLEGEWDAVWDRAALVALPADMRREYSARLASVIRPGGAMLLATLVYPQDQRQGPPFSVDPDEVHALHHEAFEVHALGGEQLIGDDLPPWGISWLRRDLWRARRRST